MYKDNMSRNIELITDARCIVGEGPIWDEKNNRLLMVDIQGKRMRSINWDNLAINETVLPQQTGFFLLSESGRLLCGAEDGVYEVLSDGRFMPFSKPCKLKGARFNDGKVGPDGRAYLGTFSRDNSAAFYRMDAEGNLTELFDKVGNSNGLDWSADGKTFYYNDTPTHKTDAFDFDIRTGELSARRSIYTYESGNPDGMTVDSNGNLWSAAWGAGEAICICPENGKVIDRIKLPVSQVACCAFAGSSLDTLVITTAAHGVNLKDEPLAGSVFAVNIGVKGIRPYRMKL